MSSLLRRIPPLVLVAGTALAAAARAERFKLEIADPGVHAVSYEELAAAGLGAPAVATASLGLSSRGEPVPLWVADGGDGAFGPGDRVEFIAERLAGEFSYYNDYSSYNVYWLDLAASAPWHGRDGAVQGSCTPALASVERHDERDLLRVRFPGRVEAEDEIWYWSRFTYLEDASFEMDVDLSDLATDSARPLSIEVAVRGWSILPPGQYDLDDHAVEVLWDGVSLATHGWDGSNGDQIVEIPAVPPELARPGLHHLTLRVPKRTNEEGEPLVDVVLLNWIELAYPRDTTRLAGQDRVAWQAEGGECVELPADPAQRVLAYRADGWRFAAGEEGTLRLARSDDPALWLVAAGGQRQVPRLALDAPSSWRSADRQADYLMIAHPSLAAAVEPLAEFHRGRGLTVEVVDVRDLYDEFSDGIETPAAIRDFVRHAWEAWRRPAPRFVLLVGDASWDTKNPTVVDENYADWTFGTQFRNVLEQFPKNVSTPYAEHPELNVRNLVPSWSTVTFQGHAASDNGFVSFADDGEPSLAIGRFPVLEPAEVQGIVAKSIAYASRPPVGPWRARALFITNEDEHHKKQSDTTAAGLAARGFSIDKVYPLSSEVSNEHHTQRLIEAFGEGQLLVHFLGHGGRYIWRTGPPDYKKNHDLFTLDDLDELAPSDRVAIVLSMSCYSAPFDHPNADSIGEKFLRLPDRGAAAVIAASWRNAPARDYSQSLLDELSQPGATVGEALMRAKHRVKARAFRDQYNLLGDPALPVALPQWALQVEASPQEPGTVRVAVPAPRFDGQALVEWRGAEGDLLGSELLTVTSPQFVADLGGEPAAPVAAVHVYVWSETLGLDGLGTLQLASPDAAPDTGVAGAATSPGAPSPNPAPGGSR